MRKYQFRLTQHMERTLLQHSCSLGRKFRLMFKEQAYNYSRLIVMHFCNTLSIARIILRRMICYSC